MPSIQVQAERRWKDRAAIVAMLQRHRPDSERTQWLAGLGGRLNGAHDPLLDSEIMSAMVAELAAIVDRQASAKPKKQTD